MQYSPGKTSLPDERIVRVRLLGTGAADPTVQVVGPRVTVTRTAAGVYKFVFNDGMGTFIGLGAPRFGAATPGDVKGQTCTRGAYTDATATAAGFISISVWSSTFAADDLQATEFLDLSFIFSENSEVA